MSGSVLAALGMLIAFILILAIWYRAFRVPQLRYRERALAAGGRCQRRIADYVGRPLKWVSVSLVEFDLCADDAILATLHFDDGGRLTSGRTFENVWVARYEGWPGQTFTLHPYRLDLPPQVTVKRRWGLGHSATAKFANGQIYSFSFGICNDSAGLRLFSCDGHWLEVTLEPEARLLPDIALLVLVGSVLKINAGTNDD